MFVNLNYLFLTFEEYSSISNMGQFGHDSQIPTSTMLHYPANVNITRDIRIHIILWLNNSVHVKYYELYFRGAFVFNEKRSRHTPAQLINNIERVTCYRIN